MYVFIFFVSFATCVSSECLNKFVYFNIPEQADMSDKQTQAVIFNFKEQRRLEKTLQALKIEEAYAVSLINLDGKVLKIGYKRLKDRVAKTKSHLSKEQINEMKDLEDEGKLPEKVIKMESEVRIAAAEKRLKLWSAKKARTVTPRSNRAQTATEMRSRCPSFGEKSTTGTNNGQSEDTSLNLTLKSVDTCDSEATSRDSERRQFPNSNRSASDIYRQKRKVGIKTDAFMSSPTKEGSKGHKTVDIRTPEEMTITNDSVDETSHCDKPKSKSLQASKNATELHKTETETAFIKRVPDATNRDKNLAVPVVTSHDQNLAVPVATYGTTARPQSEGLQAMRTRSNNWNKKRPATSVPRGSATREKLQNDIRRLSRLLAEGNTRAPFSSHDLDQKNSKSEADNPFRSIRDGPMTAFENKSIDKDHGADLYKSMKKEFMLKEVVNSLHIEDKIDSFFEKVDDYISENKDPAEDNRIDDIKIPVPLFRKDTRDNLKTKPKRNVLRRRELEFALHGNTSAERKQEVWKDVNKCRYLRVPEELIDLTGIQTLASDQMKLFDMMRSGGYGEY